MYGIFENWNFNDFFFAFLNMGPYGSENFKPPLLVQVAAENSFVERSLHASCYFNLHVMLAEH